MNGLIKKIHMYLGLLNLTILLVFGFAGLRATFSKPGGGPSPDTPARTESFTALANIIDDKALLDLVRQRLNIPAAGSNSKRDPANNLLLTYYSPTGPWFVTVLEKEGQLRIVRRLQPFGGFVDNLHAMANRYPDDWRVKLWSYYNEFSVWSLIAMALTGIYLWLCSRPKYGWAQVSFAVGSAVFLLLFFLSR